MKKEYNRIRKLAKRVVPRRQLKKLKHISDIGERSEALKYLVVSVCKGKHLELVHVFEKRGVDSFLLSAKLELLPRKIRILETSHQKRDYDSVLGLVAEIEEVLG